MSKFDIAVIDLVESATRTMKTAPLILGGVAGSGGGVGSPPGGFVGWLPQGRVAYDYDEFASSGVPLSGMSLVDNLNHIRNRLNVLESGGSIIITDDNNSLSYLDTTNLHFVGSGVVVTDLGSGSVRVTINATGSGGGSGITQAAADARYLKLDASNDPLTNSLSILPTTDNYTLYLEAQGDNSMVDIEQYANGGTLTRDLIFGYQEADATACNAIFLDGIRWSNGAGTFTGDWIYLEDQGSPKFVVTSNGNAYTRGSLLITDAPSNGTTYARNNGAWVTVSGLGVNQFFTDQSGGTSDTYGILSGLVNSSNALYTVSASGYVSGSLLVFLNGQLQTQGTGQDWVETTPSGGTFTFNTAPTTGDNITAHYMKSITSAGNADTLDGYHASSFRKSTSLITKTADYAVASTDDIILCNNASGIVLTLPPATGTGVIFNIKLINTGTVTVSGYSTNTIDGSNIKIIDTIYDNLTIVDGGTGTWYII